MYLFYITNMNINHNFGSFNRYTYKTLQTYLHFNYLNMQLKPNCKKDKTSPVFEKIWHLGYLKQFQDCGVTLSYNLKDFWKRKMLLTLLKEGIWKKIGIIFSNNFREIAQRIWLPFSTLFVDFVFKMALSKDFVVEIFDGLVFDRVATADGLNRPPWNL